MPLFFGRGQFPGTATNDSASTGNIGEYLSSITTAGTATVTISNASPGIVTWSSHGLNIGSAVNFTTNGGLPTGLSTGTNYYVSSQSFAAGTFAVSSSVTNALAGTSINTSSAGSGTHTGSSRVLLTSNSTINVTGISLTAGDWDVHGGVIYTAGGATVIVELSDSISVNSATLASASPEFYNDLYYGAGITLANNGNITVPLVGGRISLASTTTYFLPAFSTFSASTLSAWGKIWARRAR